MDTPVNESGRHFLVIKKYNDHNLILETFRSRYGLGSGSHDDGVM